MKLYITPGSPYARMARIVVLEKGLDDRVEIIIAKTRTANSPYYRINPSGRVPYLITEEDVGQEESALICSYLARGCAGGYRRATDRYPARRCYSCASGRYLVAIAKFERIVTPSTLAWYQTRQRSMCV